MRWKIGTVAGLELRAARSVPLSFIVLWILLSAVGVLLLDLPLVSAIVGGGVAAAFHWLAELWHNLGHAWAARRTGHPMRGVLFWGPMAISRYPRDEGDLPAEVHIRRALGGPLFSLFLTIVAGIVAWLLRPAGGLTEGSVPFYATLFLFLDNLLIFTIGAFLPLGFTDGSTLLEWWPKRASSE